MMARTRNILSAPMNWCVVEALAKALIEYRRLKYKAAKEIAHKARVDAISDYSVRFRKLPEQRAAGKAKNNGGAAK
jgi:hypothetical protein